MAMRITTVTGNVAPESLGYIDAHSHCWIEPVPGAAPDAPVLHDYASIVQELREFRAAGGSAIIECQPANCGRNGNRLREMSEASGVRIIACTGFHLRRYYAPDNAPLWNMTAEQAGQCLVEEIRGGLSETRLAQQVVYPGFIKIAAEASLGASPLHLFEAAAYASLETGYAIEMHTERGADIEAFLSFFVERGLSPHRLVFCHVDKRCDFGLHCEMAQAGVMLEYDTFYRPKYDPENNVWKLIPRMIAAGLASHIALATDMAGGELWSRLGNGPGQNAFFTVIKARLESTGVQADVVRGLMGANIAARLAVDTHPGRNSQQ